MSKVVTKKVLKDIKLSELFVSKATNFRRGWNYKVERKPNFNAAKDTPGFYEDVAINGVLMSPEVVLLTPEQVARYEVEAGFKPKYLVARGNRRVTAAVMVNEEFPGKIEKLTCIVHENLSDAEIAELMFDDKGTEHLDEYEQYTVIEKYFLLGKSQSEIARITAYDRNLVQHFFHIAEMPLCVRENLDKKSKPVEGKKAPEKWVDFAPLTHPQHDKLYTAYKKDRSAGVNPTDPGSEFAQLWESLTSNTKPPKPPTKKSLSREDMLQRVGIVEDSGPLKAVLAFAMGDEVNLKDAAQEYKNVESLAARVPALESEITSLKEQVENLLKLVDEKDAEIATLKASQPTNGVHVN